MRGWASAACKLPLMVAVLLLLASCSQADGLERPHEMNETKVLYLSSNKEQEGSARIISQLSREYEAETAGFTYEFENVAESDLSQRVQLLAASNDLPVLFSYQSGKPLIDMIRSDALLDLEDTFEELGILGKLSPAAVELLKAYANGEGLYALPLELNIEGFWYNKRIFGEYGIEVPKTWTDMLAAAEKLHANGVQPFAVAGKDKWPITRLINAYAIRVYGADVMERVDKGEVSLTSRGFVEAAETVQRMGLSGYFGPRVNTVDMASSVDAFLQGRAAMFYMGSWQLRAFNDETQNRIGEDSIGFFSIPLVEGGSGTLDEYPVNAGLTTSFSKAAYTPEVGKWMKFVFERYGERAMSELGMITGFQVDHMPADLPPLTKLVQEKINEVSRAALWFEARFDTNAQLLAWDQAQLLVTDESYEPLQYLTALQTQLDRER
ncbi:extracellular solute-binding protein [Paenibacillus nanensis]|uniref:Extracellular solute-binding protein n=1 Tax=Paenibacillus nanensis TaxID=393251 RepID=A0A3A1VM25_9BACL|nr:extracellular solute-binding protein [Paenibacillus nanensis]RIX59563.1 extracellular solute-binding protein [Paenibacillus nanensis]